MFLYARLLWAFKKYPTLASSFVRTLLVTAAGAVASLFLIDSLYYGRPISTPLNFVLTNFTSVSLFYGSNPWHYYLTQALPILCTTALPFVLHGMYTTFALYKGTPKRSVALENMFYAIVWFIGVYSFAGHKEWRFIHPILPLLHIFAAKSLVDLGVSAKKTSPSKKTKGTSKRPTKESSLANPISAYLSALPIRSNHLTLLLATLPISSYIVLFYCSAPISVLSYIRSLPIPSQTSAENFTDTIGFLTPCHSTPVHSHLHRPHLALVPGRLWFLGCEPPLNLPASALSTYKDQTNVFYANPKAYLLERFPPEVNTSFPPSPYPRSAPGETGVRDWKHEWPKHIVMFGELLGDTYGVKGLLGERGYEEVWKAGREWEGEDTRKGGVRVWKWMG